MTKTTNPAGEWSEPLLVQPGKGLIDPTPFWDEDGKAYLAFAFAGSRAGVKSILMVSRMKSDGTALLGNGVMVFDGHDGHRPAGRAAHGPGVGQGRGGCARGAPRPGRRLCHGGVYPGPL